MCISKQYPTQLEIRSLFDYDDGKLIWRENRSNIKAGSVAGTLNRGYYQIRINGKHYQLHRLIYIYFNGDIPSGSVIDHRDGNNGNNRIENLQAITNQQNVHKSKLIYSTNSSGYRGVYWNKAAKKWYSQITINGKNLYLGLFDNITDAAIAYDIAAIKYHKEFARTNFPLSDYVLPHERASYKYVNKWLYIAAE